MEDLLEHALRIAVRLGASYAEARYQREAYEEVLVKNGDPEVSGATTSRGVSVRVICKGALGFASTTELNKGGINTAVREAIRAAKAASSLVKKEVRMSDAELHSDRVVVKPRIKPEDVDLDDKIALLRDIDRLLVESSSRRGVKAPGRIIELGAGYSEKHVITTDGADVRQVVPRCMATYIYSLHGDGRSLQRHENLGEARGWEAVERWRLDEKIPSEAASLSRAIHEAETPPRGVIDVVLSPEIVGLICHESAGHPAEADRMLGREAAQAGETYIKPELLGSKIGSEAVTIVDDPTLPSSFGFYLYDDEGVRARERVLIENGRIKELLHNRETAAEMGLESNGASRANLYNREPIVRMANTYMKAGELTLEELLEDIGHGVYIKSYQEWNIDDKRWNQRYVGVEAYLIEHGEATRMVWSPVIELTTRGLYEAIDAKGSDLAFFAGYCGKGDPMQGIPVWFGGPSIRLRGIRLGETRAKQ